MLDRHTLYLIIGLSTYVIVVIGYSIRLALKRRQDKTLDPMVEFYAAGRSLGGFPLTFTMFATLFSAFTVVGMPGFFYTHGIGAWAFVVFADLALVFTFFFYGLKIVHLAHKHNLTSPVELLWISYRSRIVTTLSVILLAVFVMPLFSIQIAGMGKLLEATSKGFIPYSAGAGLMLFVILIYSMVGGLKADVATDIIQGIIMLIVMAIVCLWFLGGAWNFDLTAMFNAIIKQDKAELLSIPGPVNYFTLPTLISFFVLFMLVPITNPHMLSRFYAAKSKRVVLHMAMWFPILTILMFIPGLIIGLGGAAICDVDSGDKIMSEVLRTYIPPGLAAAVAVGVAAAAMSTSDSLLLALGAMFTRDVYKPLVHPQAEKNEELWVGRGIMLLLVVGGFVVALNPPKLIVQLSILSLEGMAILAPTYVGAVTTKLRSPSAAIASILSGLITFIIFQTPVLKSWLFGFRPGLLAVTVAAVIYLLVAVGTRRHTNEPTSNK